MSGDPRVDDGDCWWCLGEGIVYGPCRDKQDCPQCDGSGDANEVSAQ